jgi:uroporphyrinogen decarboxylase
MTRRMTKRARLEAALTGAQPDRAPVALWRHWPGDDQRPDTFARAVLDFQQAYDWDFVKVTPASSFCLVDWGVRDVWMGNPEGTRDYVERAVVTPDDWLRLRPLNPRRGALGRHVQALELIAKGLKPGTPFLPTVFSPLAQAKNLAGGERLLVHLREAPEAVHEGLATITTSILRFLDAVRPLAPAGIFYAIQHASRRVLAPDEYRAFGRPYDLEVLEAAQDLWLNVVHLHGEDVYFDAVCDYPAAALNWHDREAGPSLAAGLQRWRGVRILSASPQGAEGGAACGGIARWATLVRGTPDDVRREVRQALHATQGRRLIVSTGCVTPIVTPIANLHAVKEGVKG